MPQLDIYTFLHQVSTFALLYLLFYYLLVTKILPKIYRTLSYRRYILRMAVSKVNGLITDRLVLLSKKNYLVVVFGEYNLNLLGLNSNFVNWLYKSRNLLRK